MKYSNAVSCFLSIFVFSLGIYSHAEALDFSGRCYQGKMPDQNRELQGVNLTLYGAPAAGGQRTQLDTYTTGSTQSNGWYRLTIVAGYEHYYIVASTPSGYTFHNASSVDGSVLGNEIHYSTEKAPLDNQTLTGNKFWFEKEGGGTQNNPPVADADGPYVGKVGQPVIVDGSGSSDPDPGDAIISYEWDLDYNGQYDDATGIQPSYTWHSVGMFKIGLRVTDKEGATDTDRSTVTIEESSAEKGILDGYKYDANTNQALAGWRIYLDLNKNDQWDNNEPNAVTDGSGYYRFEPLEPGTYRVCEVGQPGWTTICINHVDIVGGVTTTLDFHNYREGDPEPDELDYGDAPDSYQTLHASGGAYHLIQPGAFFGNSVDAEGDGQLVPAGLGDDSDGNDDEDGTRLYGDLVPGQQAIFSMVILNPSMNLRSVGWIDFDQDGVFQDPSERIPGSVISWGGFFHMWAISFAVPANAKVGKTYARFRVFEDRPNLVISPTGYGGVGEVEDHEIEIKPDGKIIPPGQIVGGFKWNDLNGNGIHDAGEPGLGGWTIWIDLNANGSKDPGEETLTNPDGSFYFMALNPGIYQVYEEMQAGWTQTYPGGSGVQTLTVQSGQQPSEIMFGNHRDRGGQDFGDAPNSYGTVITSTGAYHQVGSLTLGLNIDPEADGQPTPDAQGDDMSFDDEDGVVHLHQLNLTAGQPGHVTLEIYNHDPVALDSGTIIGWIDFNGDNHFQHGSEEIGLQHVTVPSASHVTVTLSFPVPINATIGSTFARFRLYRDDPNPQAIPILLSPLGDGGIGEVEDYAVNIERGPTKDDRDYGDAPLPYPSASHSVGGPWLGGSGDLPDVEKQMQRDPQAQGDDTDVWGDDENGLAQAHLVRGSTSLSFIGVTFLPSSTGDVTLAAWIDLNADGDWMDSGEALGVWPMTITPPPPGAFGFVHMPYIPVNIPAHAHVGNTVLRLRIYEGKLSHVSFSGNGVAGEVEDHLVEIVEEGLPKPEGAVIWGIKFEDSNGNGVFDPAIDPLLPNWPVWLDINHNGVQDPGDPVTQTDFFGMFMFTGLKPNTTYTVGEELPPGWLQIYPGTPGTHSVKPEIPQNGVLYRPIMFGNMPTEGAGGLEEELAFLKWSQPLLEIDPNLDPDSGPPIFCATHHTARSTHSSSNKRQWSLIVDDFHCQGPMPVTKIRWWGSYKAWTGEEPPAHQPALWHIGFWAYEEDEKKTDDLYPERLMWSVEVPFERVNFERVGKLDYPGRWPETCFVYELQLSPEEWFHQAEYPARGDLFWISVTAVYSEDTPQKNLWGWNSRIQPWRESPLQLALLGEWPDPEERLFPERIYPIKTPPLCSEECPHDMAFELLTGEPWVLWDQPFTGLRDWPWYWDELAMTVIEPQQDPYLIQWVADDWIAERETPVIALAWYGSYLGYGYEACDCNQLKVTEPRRPDYFYLTIRDNSHSDMPGQILWEYEARDYDEIMVNYDRHPEDDPNEAVYRYHLRLPNHHWFDGVTAGQQYWLTVEAVYEAKEEDIPYPWGWTVRRHEAGHPAKALDFRQQGDITWRPVRDPVDKPVDMCFTVFTLPE